MPMGDISGDVPQPTSADIAPRTESEPEIIGTNAIRGKLVQLEKSGREGMKWTVSRRPAWKPAIYRGVGEPDGFMTEAFDAYALPDNPRLYPTGHTEGERIEESYVKRGEGNSQGVEIGMRHTRIYPEPQSVDGRNVLGTITDINAAGDVRQVNLILGDNDSVTPDYQRRYKGDDPNAQEITKALYADLDASVAIPSQPSAPAPSNSAS